ncbi:MAG: Gfo/Idh/MocA family oxidoreductase [Acidimicrobiales bacterium]|nr:Gfo/Idh/MocA family oxidoreductase [Acidimicrobiales bacterium]
MRRRQPSVLVLGAGSAGNRHARNLDSAGAKVSVADPCADRTRATSVAERVPFDSAHLDGFDGVVIATPPSAHLSQVLAALETGAKVFVENPVSTSVAGTESLLLADDRVMVDHHLRFHSPVVRLLDMARSGRAGRITAVRSWYGSYLPDRRPTIDYRATSSARAALGGGALLDAIHDLDLVTWLLGTDLEIVAAQAVRLGDLDVDVEDTVAALLRQPAGALATLSYDYLSRRYRRGLEIVGTDATLRLDWSREIIEVEQAGDTEVEPAIDSLASAHERQTACFVAWIRGDEQPPVPLAESLAALRLADQLREVAAGPQRSSYVGAPGPR